MYLNMNKMTQKSILEYWQDYIKKCQPLIKDWLEKENLYLRKNTKEDSIVLDVGCGFGRNIKAIVNLAKKIVGIDNNQNLFEEIKEKLSKFKNVEVFLENARKMHFGNNIFDYTICMGNTFGTFGKDKLKILKEMKRVTKKGGKIIISVYSENALDMRIEEYKRIGIKIKKIQDGTIYSENGLILEQFNKEKLKKIFDSVELEVKIIKLNSISYLCESII